MELDFEVVELPDSDHPTEGETAPDFTRPLVNEEYWEDASLSAVTAEGPGRWHRDGPRSIGFDATRGSRPR